MHDTQQQSPAAGGGVSGGGFGGRFASFGASLRQQAQELSSKAAAQVTEINSKLQVVPPAVGGASTASSAGPSNVNATKNAATISTASTPTAAGIDASLTSPAAAVSTDNIKLADNVDKKDLVEMLQKMNKKVKALSMIRQQLLTKLESVETEKDRLRLLIVDEILNGTVHLRDDEDEVMQLQSAWRQVDEQNALALQQLQNEFQLLRRNQLDSTKSPTSETRSSSWESERELLIQSYERQIMVVRQDLEQKHALDLQKVREEFNRSAQEREQAVQTEKQDAITEAAVAKMNEDMISQLNKDFQIKLEKQQLLHHENMEDMKVKMQQSIDMKLANERINLNMIHEAELQRVREEATASLSTELETCRQSVEQRLTTEMEEKLQEVVGDLKRKHHGEIEALQTEYKRKVAELSERGSSLKEAYEIEQKKVSALREEMNNVQGDKETVTFELKSELQVLRNERERLLKEFDKRNDDLTRIVKEKDDMVKNLKSVYEKQSENDRNMSITIDSLKAEHSKELLEQKLQMEKTIETLRSEIRDEQSTLDAMNREIEQLLAVKSAAEADSARLKKDIEALRIEHEAELSNLHEKHSAEKKVLISKVEHGEGIAPNLYEDLQSTNSALQDQIEKSSFEAAQSIQGLQEERLLMSQKLQQALDELKALRQENSNIADLKFDINRLQEDLLKAESELQEARKTSGDKLAEMTRSIENLNHHLVTLKSEKEQLGTESKLMIAEKDSEIVKLKADYNKIIEDMKKKEAAVAQTFSKVKAAYAQKIKTTESDYVLKISQLEGDKLELQKKISNLEEMLMASSKKSAEELEVSTRVLEKRLEDNTKASALEVTKLNKQLSVAIDDSNQLRTQIDHLSTEIDSLRLQNSTEVKEQQYRESIQQMENNHKLEMENLRHEHEKSLMKAQESTDRLKTEHELQLHKMEQQKAVDIKNLKQAFSEEKDQLRQSLAEHVDKLTQQFKSKLELIGEHHAADTLELKKQIGEKDQKLSEQNKILKELNASLASLKKENEGLRSRLLAVESSKVEIEEALERSKKDLAAALVTSTETATSFLKEQEVLEKEKKALLARVSKLETEMKFKINLIEELQDKQKALSSNLSMVVEERDKQAERLTTAERQEMKLKAAENEVSELRELTNKLKLDLTKNANLVERLQADKEANERSHGQRTALVGMLEAQLSEAHDRYATTNAKLEAATYDLHRKDELLLQNEELVHSLRNELQEARTTAKKAADALANAQKGPDTKLAKLVDSLQKEIQTAKQQMAKKSAAAQQLVQEKEAECVDLRRLNRELQQEVDKGSLSDRRILELAAKQSNRESHQISEIEIRDRTIDKMKEKLLERDTLLASKELHVQEVEGRVEELCRVRRREDVNMDYLKSTIVKYLSLPSGSSERAALLPVIATLLQFDANDYRTIEDGRNKVSWWGSIAPTMISAPNERPSLNTGEISLTRPNGSNESQKRPTSLQF